MASHLLFIFLLLVLFIFAVQILLICAAWLFAIFAIIPLILKQHTTEEILTVIGTSLNDTSMWWKDALMHIWSTLLFSLAFLKNAYRNSGRQNVVLPQHWLKYWLYTHSQWDIPFYSRARKTRPSGPPLSLFLFPHQLYAQNRQLITLWENKWLHLTLLVHSSTAGDTSKPGNHRPICLKQLLTSPFISSHKRYKKGGNLKVKANCVNTWRGHLNFFVSNEQFTIETQTSRKNAFSRTFTPTRPESKETPAAIQGRRISDLDLRGKKPHIIIYINVLSKRRMIHIFSPLYYLLPNKRGK